MIPDYITLNPPIESLHLRGVAGWLLQEKMDSRMIDDERTEEENRESEVDDDILERMQAASSGDPIVQKMNELIHDVDVGEEFDHGEIDLEVLLMSLIRESEGAIKYLELEGSTDDGGGWCVLITAEKMHMMNTGTWLLEKRESLGLS